MKIGLKPVEKYALVNELRRLITVKANYKSQKRRINKISTFLMWKKFKFKPTVRNKSLRMKTFANFIEKFVKADFEILKKNSQRQ
jgi:hypothetical protein